MKQVLPSEGENRRELPTLTGWGMIPLPGSPRVPAGSKPDISKPTPVELSTAAREINLRQPTLRETIATRVLDLFRVSVIWTLLFAGALLFIDALFIFFKAITPEQRLMTEKIVMTFVSATIVQVGAAIAAITLAVFKTEPGKDTG
jgi:hypothetical protein